MILEKMRPIKPFADITSKHLKPLSFKRAGNHWRLSTDETHIAIELEHCLISGELFLHIGAWIRRIEDVALETVKPDLLSIHVKTDIWNLLPRLEYYYFRAALFSILPQEYDSVLSPQFINHAMDYAHDEEKWMVEESYIKNPPIGLAAKTRIFESALTKHFIPFLKNLESESAILECVRNEKFEIQMQDEAAQFLGISIFEQSEKFVIFSGDLDAKRHMELYRARCTS